ncbi:DCN1-like protein 4 [Mangifera indica]|uniref:DCN1-like protein 4 n=1 Tax=Mangifera indica TaxID=29780 RepID=UPI001CF93C7E|nr:DCN1-like protein 4 [Mangifera indica]
MPPSSKRKAAAPPSPSRAKSSSDPRSAKAKTKEREQIALFNRYANDGVIDPDGIMALCKDLKMEHTDVRILMFAWKLKAAKQGYFTLDEWQNGLETLQVDTFCSLKKAVSELEKGVIKEPSQFADFHAFAYRYHLTEERQKFIDIETTCELLNVVLRSQFSHQVDSFIEYLKVQTDYQVISLDQWENFLRFCQEVSFPDVENYDETLAWPVILDSFVEWLREKQ